MKEAKFWEPNDGKILCRLCARHCVVAQGKVGLCGVRVNEQNKFYPYEAIGIRRRILVVSVR